jgi:serine/threonine protein phosphatase PrpC
MEMKKPLKEINCSQASAERSWRYIAASVRGSSHEKTDKPCQDAHYLERPSPDILVAAVADGAGSASFAEIGATIAARTAVKSLCERITAPEVTDIVESIREALIKAIEDSRFAVGAEATLRGVDERELASTLLLAIAKPSFLAAVQIGDGGIVVRDTQGSIVAVTKPQPGEYINETVFLISAGALEHAQVEVCQADIAQFAMLSDGLQLLCLKMPEGTPYERFFSPVFDFIGKASNEGESTEQLIKFLNSSKVKGHTDDDITLILADFREADHATTNATN